MTGETLAGPFCPLRAMTVSSYYSFNQTLCPSLPTVFNNFVVIKVNLEFGRSHVECFEYVLLLFSMLRERGR